MIFPRIPENPDFVAAFWLPARCYDVHSLGPFGTFPEQEEVKETPHGYAKAVENVSLALVPSLSDKLN